MTAIASEIEKLIGKDKFTAWENLDPKQQENIKNAIAPGTTPAGIAYPHTQTELAEIMTTADRHQWRILPCGSGSKIDWGGLVQNINLIISTQHLNNIIDHAAGDLTITVEAGIKLIEIQKILAQANQFLALNPAYPNTATLGGIIATADSGSLRQKYGGVRDQLIGFSCIRSDGKIAKAGGRVVKNVAGYDLMKLITGSYGTLGIISQVTFRVYPLPETSQTVILTGEAEAIYQANQTLLNSALTPTAIDLISPQLNNKLGWSKKPENLGLIVRFQNIAESVKEQSDRLAEVGQKLGLQVQIFSDNHENNLWELLPEQIVTFPPDTAIICKIGVIPSEAVKTLQKLDTLFQGLGFIHAGSGLGKIYFPANTNDVGDRLSKLRDFCQSNNGFLTILTAPKTIKEKLDIWGYNGNALNLMRQIKNQFDPKNLLSPHRFINGI